MNEIKEILGIIEMVLFKREISLNELYFLWPESLSDDEFFENIYDDIESAVEHLSFLPLKELSKSQFRNSVVYRILVIDYKILKSNFNISQLKVARSRIDFHKQVQLSEIDDIITNIIESI